MEYGFYNTQQGYWQVTSAPTEAVVLAWPDNTVSVPLKPAGNFDWIGGQWTEVAEYVSDPSRDLTKAEFNRLLHISGLDDVWDAVAEHLKATDRPAYAKMMGERDKNTFQLDCTLTQIADMAPIIEASGATIDATDVVAIWAQVAGGD